MKTRFTAILCLLAAGLFIQAQSLTELVVPRFFGSKSTGSTNNTRTPLAVCLRIDGLLPATVYDVKGGLALLTDPSTAFGAGNIWDGSGFSSSRLTAAFMTDASGSSGPFWLFLQPTANSARFDAGQQHNLRIGYAVTGGTIPSVPAFVGSKTLTALDIAVNQRTPLPGDDGAFVRGTALPQASGKYVLLFDNIQGTGDPVFAYQVRQAVPVQTSGQSDLPAVIGDIYQQAGSSTAGDYPAVIPTGSNNPSGIRRVETRNADLSLFAWSTDDDGIWPSGANTAGAVRREVVVITSSDAPLVPQGPVLPTVCTDSSVTVLTYDSVVAGGIVSSDGGDTVTLRGVCWSTLPLPSLTDPFVSVPGDTGMFTAVLSNLSPDTLYHFRAFAVNSAGTAFGSGHTFRTPCEPIVPVSNFWTGDTVIFIGDSVDFFDSTSHCPETWNWSFVGGIPMSASVPNPTGIVFNYPGEFNVCLTTSNSSGVHTLCRHGYINVREPVIPNLVITEIMYNPPESGTDSLEFIELYNNDTVPVNLLDLYFAEGVSFVFPDMDLAPGGFVVVGKNDSALYRTFGISGLKWTSGSLTNTGELILLKDGFGHTVDSVDYDDSAPWDPLCAGHGYSLELCDPGQDNSLGENWRHALGFAAVNAAGDSIWAHPGEGCLLPPLAAFSASDSTVMEGDSVLFTSLATGGALTFEWTFQGGDPGSFNGEFPPAVVYSQPGMFDVSLKVTNLAGEDLLVMNGFIEAGEYTGVAKMNNRFTLYPNPSDGAEFRVGFGSPGNYRVTVISAEGRILTEADAKGVPVIAIKCAFPPSIYFIAILNLDDGSVSVQKLVIR